MSTVVIHGLNGLFYVTRGLQFGATPAPVVTTPTSGGGGKKHEQHSRLGVRDFWQPHDPDAVVDAPETRESVEVVQARERAKDLSQQIIEGQREVARIKTQMRLSTNTAAMQALEREIQTIEKHLLEAKREAEDFILLTLLM